MSDGRREIGSREMWIQDNLKDFSKRAKENEKMKKKVHKI